MVVGTREIQLPKIRLNIILHSHAVTSFGDFLNVHVVFSKNVWETKTIVVTKNLLFQIYLVSLTLYSLPILLV